MDSWYYIVDGAQRGPLPGNAMLRMLEKGVIPAETAVWRPGEDNWQQEPAHALLFD